MRDEEETEKPTAEELVELLAPPPLPPSVNVMIVDPATGQIKEQRNVPALDVDAQNMVWIPSGDHMVPILDPTIQVVEGKADALTQYIQDGNIVDRPVLYDGDPDVYMLANGWDEVRFDVPAGTYVTYNSERYTLDEEFVFSTVEAGIYEFVIDPPFPYRQLNLRITADD